MSNICVLGSINMDMVYEVEDIPKEGETITAKSLNLYPGGKGLNQAIAASRLGGDVSFIGKVGDDEFGKHLINVLKDEKVNSEYVKYSTREASGQAVIMIDSNAKNCITVLGGANMSLVRDDIESAVDVISKSKVMIAQLEVPIEAVITGFKIAKEKDVLTIFNPAPAKNIPDELYGVTDIIIPNESELEKISGKPVTTIDEAVQAGKEIINKGVKIVIATLGDQGAVVISKKENIHVEGHKVKAVDTTAAGDSFIGAIAYKLLTHNCIIEENIRDIVDFSNKAASITVQRKGAQPSLPYLWEVVNGGSIIP